MFGFVCELIGGHRGRHLPAAIRAAPGLVGAVRHAARGAGWRVLAGVLRGRAGPDVLLLRLRGLRRRCRGDAQCQPYDPQGDADDDLRRRVRGDPGLPGAGDGGARRRRRAQGRRQGPVATTLRAAMGEWGFRAVIAIVLVSFGSCVLSLQAAASRVVFAYARDDMIAGSEWLKRLSPRTHVPTLSLVLSGGDSGRHRGVRVVAAERGGHDHQFRGDRHLRGVPDDRAGALMARLRGWQPAGPFSLGALGWPVNIVALAWQVLRSPTWRGRAAPRTLVEQLFGDVHDRRRAGPGVLCT